MVCSAPFGSLCFGRSGRPGCFVLLGVPASRWSAVSARLSALGCVVVSAGSSWFCFRCSAAVAGALALRVPAPVGRSPLWVSARSGCLLAGAAAAAAAAARGGRGSLSCAVQPVFG